MSSNIEVKLDVLNQKGSPALFASSLATRPAASFTGRLFVDSDSPSTGIYRDTGSVWVQVADQGAGTTGTLQQVTTNGSSTTVGISTSGNGIGIGTTIPATNRLDIHSASGLNATFNGTGVTNAALQFQLAGIGKWNVGNLYNSNNNDFIISDVVNTLNRVTIKNTGQTFIGADTTSSGLLVVNNASTDSHIVVLGANSPSIRIRDSGSSLVQNVGIGISTGTNAFIQGSASGNYCIFNSSTTASPILFGVYDAGTSNTQEAVRISAARNLLVGTSTDAGYKLDVNGTGRFTGAATFSSSVTAGGQITTQYANAINNIRGTSGSSSYLKFTEDGVADRWSIGSEAGSYQLNFRQGGTGGTALMVIGSTGNLGIGTTSPSDRLNVVVSTNGNNSRFDGPTSGLILQTNATTIDIISYGGTTSAYRNLNFSASASTNMTITTGGNVGIGTTTDAGFKLDVSGTGRFTGTLTGTSATYSSSVAIGNTVTASVINTVTNKVSILIGGIQYYLLASTSAV